MRAPARRLTTFALLVAAAAGSGLSAEAASAATPTGPSTSLSTAPPSVQPVGLLLPAVQAAREAARRSSCN